MANQYRKRDTDVVTEKSQTAKSGQQMQKARSIADALIAKASARGESLPDFLKAELTKLMEHNDTAPRSHRVNMAAALDLCAQQGCPMSASKFDRVLTREFGRSWGSK